MEEKGTEVSEETLPNPQSLFPLWRDLPRPQAEQKSLGTAACSRSVWYPWWLVWRAPGSLSHSTRCSRPKWCQWHCCAPASWCCLWQPYAGGLTDWGGGKRRKAVSSPLIRALCDEGWTWEKHLCKSIQSTSCWKCRDHSCFSSMHLDWLTKRLEGLSKLQTPPPPPYLLFIPIIDLSGVSREAQSTL